MLREPTSADIIGGARAWVWAMLIDKVRKFWIFWIVAAPFAIFLHASVVQAKRLPEGDAASRQGLILELEGRRVRSAQPFVARGVELMEAGRFNEAVTLLRRGVQVDPMDGVARTNLGVALMRTGDNHEAIAELSAAIALAPRSYIPFVIRAIVRLKMQKLEEALADINQAVSNNPLYSPAFAVRALIECEMGRWDAAIADASLSIQLGVVDPEIHVTRGRALLAIGQIQEAIADFDIALKLAPELKDRITQYRSGLQTTSATSVK